MSLPMPMKNLVDERLMCNINMRNGEIELEIYIELSTRLKSILTRAVYRRTLENTPIISPQRSEQCIGVILRYSVLVEDKKDLKKKKLKLCVDAESDEPRRKTVTRRRANTYNDISPSMIISFDWPILGVSGSDVVLWSITHISNS
jgi:hypothetical protein